MRAVGRNLALLITTIAVVAALGAGVASASQLDAVTYSIGNLPSGRQVQIYYTSGVDTANGGVVTVGSGSVLSTGLLTNAMFLRAFRGPLSATVVQFLRVSGPIAGTASLPPGATVSLSDGLSDKTYTLTNGPFTVATGLGPSSKPPRSGTQTVRCHGDAHTCEATVSIAGGASNRKLVIPLTGTNLRLVSVTAHPSSARRGYTLSHGHFALGGSEYIATLDALKSNPKGAHITLKFAS